MLDPSICLQARLSRDFRFDGKFFTAVLSTGIFCRPICPARAAKEENVRYYESSSAAQEAGYQPCKRCFPEQAPERDLPLNIKKMSQALIASDKSIEVISQEFSLSERQFRRLFNQYFGVSPIKYQYHQRLLLARKLLKTTQLSISDICFASGFKSVRRFNEVIKKAYHLTPSQLRKKSGLATSSENISVTLNYRPPFDWSKMLSFFKLRQLTGVEEVTDDYYRRTVVFGESHGWIEVKHHKSKHALQLTLYDIDVRFLNDVVVRVRRMFDLDADMQVIHERLSKDPQLANVIKSNEGVRLPGCWDIFEFSIRAILGQQISVKGATTLAARIAQKYGQKLVKTSNASFHHSLTCCFPTVEELANVDYQDIGLTRSRIATLNTWMEFYRTNAAIFTHYKSLEALEKTLTSLKGIGPWTVNYIAMRGLSDPDAFPSNDLGIIKALSHVEKTPNMKEIIAHAESWRPWRAYAAIYLWLSLAK